MNGRAWFTRRKSRLQLHPIPFGLLPWLCTCGVVINQFNSECYILIQNQIDSKTVNLGLSVMRVMRCPNHGVKEKTRLGISRYQTTSLSLYIKLNMKAIYSLHKTNRRHFWDSRGSGHGLSAPENSDFGSDEGPTRVPVSNCKHRQCWLDHSWYKLGINRRWIKTETKTKVLIGFQLRENWAPRVSNELGSSWVKVRTISYGTAPSNMNSFPACSALISKDNIHDLVSHWTSCTYFEWLI